MLRRWRQDPRKTCKACACARNLQAAHTSTTPRLMGKTCLRTHRQRMEPNDAPRNASGLARDRLPLHQIDLLAVSCTFRGGRYCHCTGRKRPENHRAPSSSAITSAM